MPFDDPLFYLYSIYRTRAAHQPHILYILSLMARVGCVSFSPCGSFFDVPQLTNCTQITQSAFFNIIIVTWSRHRCTCMQTKCQAPFLFASDRSGAAHSQSTPTFVLIYRAFQPSTLTSSTLVLFLNFPHRSFGLLLFPGALRSSQPLPTVASQSSLQDQFDSFFSLTLAAIPSGILSPY